MCPLAAVVSLRSCWRGKAQLAPGPLVSGQGWLSAGAKGRGPAGPASAHVGDRVALGPLCQPLWLAVSRCKKLVMYLKLLINFRNDLNLVKFIKNNL